MSEERFDFQALGRIPEGAHTEALAALLLHCEITSPAHAAERAALLGHLTAQTAEGLRRSLPASAPSASAKRNLPSAT